MAESIEILIKALGDQGPGKVGFPQVKASMSA